MERIVIMFLRLRGNHTRSSQDEFGNADEMGLSAITFSNRSETKQVSFTADGDWYIRIPKDCDWLTVSPSTGTGNATVNFTTTVYDATSPRTAKVAFVCDNIEQKALLQVTQLQRFFLEPTILSNVLPKNGGETTVNVSTNGTFKCEIDAAGTEWLSIVSQSDDKVVLNAKPIAETAVKTRLRSPSPASRIQESPLSLTFHRRTSPSR